MGVWALSRHKDNPCLETFLNNTGKQQCAICLKQTHSHLGHMGGAHSKNKSILRRTKRGKDACLAFLFLFFSQDPEFFSHNYINELPFDFSYSLAFTGFLSALLKGSL